MTYSRPKLPYANESLPYADRYRNLSNQERPPTDEMFDGDFNYLIDTSNNLKTIIDGVGAGILPGSENPLNAEKIPTTDGAGNISWILIDTPQLEPQAVTQDKIDLEAVGSPQLQNGSITNAKLAPQSVATGNYVLESVGTNQIADGAITNPKIAGGAITLSKLALEVAAFLIPTGSIIPYGGDISPSEAFVLPDGSNVSRITYPALFAIYGTKFGVGDGATTFGLPDLRGCLMAFSVNNNTNGKITVATANTTNIGGMGGFEQVTLDVTQMPPHSHTYERPGTPFLAAGGGIVTVLQNIFSTNVATSFAGGGLPHNNMPPFVLFNALIKT